MFGLTKNMISAIGLFIGCMIIWLSESLPISISTLIMIALLPITGLMTFDKAIDSIGVNTALFIMASSGITVAVSESLIPNYISSFIIRKFQERPRLLVFVVGVVTSLFSAFMSSLATCVLFEGILSSSFKDCTDNKQIRKSLMLAIPACAGIGGFMSPAGTPANILVLDVLNSHGIKVSFASWCAIGFSLGILTVVLFLLSLNLFIRPRKMLISQGEKENLQNKDRVIIFIVLLVIALWFVSSFVKELNITIVAIIGLALLFMPKLKILNMKTFSSKVNWDLVITMGTVSVLMTAISDSGIFNMIIKKIFAGVENGNIFIILICVSACVCIIRAFIPTTSAVVALFSPALISISAVAGIDLKILMFVLAFWAASELILIYTEPIYLITYKNKCYSEKDLLKCGVLPSAIMIVLAPILLYTLLL